MKWNKSIPLTLENLRSLVLVIINGSCHLWLMIPSSELFLVNKNLFPVF